MDFVIKRNDYGCYCKTKARLADNSRREFLLLSTIYALATRCCNWHISGTPHNSHRFMNPQDLLGFSQVPSCRFHRADDGSILAGHRCCKSCLWGPLVSVVVVLVRLPLRFIDHRSSSNSPRPPNAFPMYSSCYENNLHERAMYLQVLFGGLFPPRAYHPGHNGPKSLILAPQDIPDISG